MASPTVEVSTSAVPSSTLTILNPPPPPEKTTPTPPSRFIMFGNEWLDLQTYIARALALPISYGDFDAKYGDFADKQLVTDCVTAMKNVQGLSATFGNPTILKQKIHNDPGYIESETPPAEIYSHIVWLAMQIHNTASTFNYTFSSLKDVLNPAMGTKEERTGYLQSVLVGEGGLVSSAADMKTKTNVLLQKMLAFDTQISNANNELQKYTGQSSKILTDANQAVGALQVQIGENQDAADDAYDKWRDYTIAAVTASVGITVLSGGLLAPVGLALGIGLGIAATKQMAAYNTFMDLIKQEKAQKVQKVQLVTDLTGFNKVMPDVSSAMTKFKSNLEAIEGVWTTVGANLSYICNNYDVDQLSSLPWVVQAMRVGDATKKWQAIDDTSQQFAGNSLVSYNTATTFGQALT